MFRYAVLILISLVSNAALAQQAPQPERVPAPSPSAGSAEPSKAAISLEERLPGDHWTIELRDEITGTVSTQTNIVTEVSPTGVVRATYNLVNQDHSHSEGFNILDRSWNLINSGPWRYSPNDGTGIQKPLATGKTWTFQSNDVNTGGGYIWNRSGRSKVVGQEKLTTRAGTFETFKIETTYSRRNVKDPTKKEEVTGQTWYAPAIDHWVKRAVITRVDNHLVVNNTIELTEYGRKQ